jgi:hypothetical protein
MLRAGLVGLLACALLPARPASAQETDAAAREVAEGEKLARAGLYAESIARFKAAERLAPRAAHDCLIALSYFRLKRLGQANLFMQRCAARASGDDPAPSWVVSMGNDVKAAIGAADLAAVTLTVRPAEAAGKARFTCSAFASDEAFTPGTFHLPAGQHTLRVEADGFAPVDKQVTAASRQPVAVEITLEASAAPEPDPAAASTAAAPASGAAPAGTLTAEPDIQSAGRGPWPYVVLGVAGATLIGGVAMHIKARGTKEDAESSLERYNDLANDYESQRTITYTLYTVAVVSGAIGTWLWFKGAPDDGDGGFHASAAPTPDGGAFVTLGWRR